MYNIALIAKGITNENEFHEYIRQTYKDKIVGNIKLHTINEQPTSVFTLENFNNEEDIFMLKKHNDCNTQTYYSRDEITTYVNNAGCVWCRYKPTWDDFEISTLNKVNEIETIDKLMSECSKLSVPLDTINFNNFENTLNNITNKKILINMIGITGSGKSTVSQKLYNFITSKGASCVIVSADKWSKQGITGKRMQSNIQREIMELERENSEYKFLIVDICNENGPSSNCFGFNTSEYTTYNFYPNFNKNNFDDYQCWCLNNVLSRPLHNETTLYWLNPVSAGLATCIKVHNMKTNGLKKLLRVKNNFYIGG